MEATDEGGPATKLAQTRKDRSLRTAHRVDTTVDSSDEGAMTASSRNILMVDLNNFATFPTLSIGILVSSLRNAGHQVRLLCPLAYDVPAAERERSETRFDDIMRRVHLSTNPWLQAARSLAHRAYIWRTEKSHPVVISEVRKELEKKPDVLLLSAYLNHFSSVTEIAKIAQEMQIPVLLGGPMLNLPNTADVWRQIPGVTAVVGAESDVSIGAMVEAVIRRNDLLSFPGIMLPDGQTSGIAPPFRRLDQIPIPDFTDFPWDRYPVRVIPIMTGRGCQWGKCMFCSDVVTASGRTFRTRPLESVLLEIEELSRRHQTTNFIFIDIKLNSYPDMLRGIANNIQRLVRGAEWIGTVHVDQRDDNGLSRKDLFDAVRGGMRRVSFGLESGSQRMLDLMQKGCVVERNSEFIRHAHEAGLSIRCTMFRGFPGETAEDMRATVNFLEAHQNYIDRVRLVDFKLSEGTPIHEAVEQRDAVAGTLQVTRPDMKRAKLFYDRGHIDKHYRREVAKACSIVHKINTGHLRNSARQFDGMM
ncbi:B12-binding domain-containing radical SAM protein [Sphingobium algorifonticola]|uniref:Radical SAM protein n=1 Tax=Sphingobium algorifonticola TaxID=2008318 RepID=A0A437JE49_9SPHN|nr:radical SAM protein [Sphingobium algorifonticola]RVT43950.1 radical SAM protein [Sphingobium algorifonticola]